MLKQEYIIKKTLFKLCLIDCTFIYLIIAIKKDFYSFKQAYKFLDKGYNTF